MEVDALSSQIKDKKVVVYGIGQCGFALIHFLNTLMKDVEIAAFCD